MQKEKEKTKAEQESTKANTAKAIQFEEVREKIISIAEERGIDHRTLMRMFDSPQQHNQQSYGDTEWDQ